MFWRGRRDRINNLLRSKSIVFWWRLGFELTVNPLLAARSATRYNRRMIRSFRHKGVERFFKSGSRSGIQAAHAPRLARQLSALNAATRPEDMNRPGWDWHALKGGLYGHWSVSVNGNWRLTFAFENGDAILVDYQDYH